MKNILIALGLLFSTPALAQDTVDAHGYHMVPNDGELFDGLTTWRAETHEAGSVAGNVLFEHGQEPLVLYSRDSSGQVSSDIINSYSALNLGLFYAPHKRVSLTASAPLFLDVDGNVSQQGVGLGDVRLAGSVGLLLPEEDELSFGLSVVPFLDVPGLYSDSQLGLPGVAGGGLFAATLSDSRWALGANLGLQFAPDIEYYNLRGGERLTSSLFAGVGLTEEVALRGEVLFEPALYENDMPGTDLPLEAMLSLRGQSGDNLSWTLGGSSALMSSVGAPTWRAFAGLDLAFGARHTEPVECASCLPTEITVIAADPDGNVLDVPIAITDGRHFAEMESGDSITLPSGAYIIGVEVEPCDEVPPLVVIEGDKLLLMEPIYFDFNESTIRTPDSTAVLEELVDTLEEHPELLLVRVGGHTDERGSNEYNEDLSQRRMESVVEYLVSEGIERSRLEPVGYGERHLLDEDCGSDEECHQLNRRVEFSILERE